MEEKKIKKKKKPKEKLIFRSLQLTNLPCYISDLKINDARPSFPEMKTYTDEFIPWNIYSLIERHTKTPLQSTFKKQF